MKKNWFSVTKVHKNIYAFAEFLHWEKVVSYLIVDKKRAFLIDTGMGYQSIKNEIKKITSLPLQVLLTHAHWDHIGSVNEFETVFIFNDSYEINRLKKGFQANEILELTDEKMFSSGYLPKKYQVKGKKEFFLLNNEQTIKSDTFNIHVIHTPGHTPGSVCFLIPEFNALFTGDTVYPGPLYAQLSESHIPDYIHSIKVLSSLPSSVLHIFPGHNAVVSEKDLLNEANNLFSQLSKFENNSFPNELTSRSLSVILK